MDSHTYFHCDAFVPELPKPVRGYVVQASWKEDTSGSDAAVEQYIQTVLRVHNLPASVHLLSTLRP